ncbi:MAG: division/cell wall cluster transcriptional repressor MraZ [Patescibacteria group bacterium]
MFIGEFNYKIDAKKRLAVPAKFRDDLDGKVVVTRGLDGCLFLYTMEEWEKLAEKISSLPLSQSDARSFARVMLAGAMELEIDNSGRILLPDYLKEYADLEKEVIIAGVYNRMEIWDKDKWEDYKNEAESEVGDVAEGLKELGV